MDHVHIFVNFCFLFFFAKLIQIPIVISLPQADLDAVLQQAKGSKPVWFGYYMLKGRSGSQDH